MVSAAISAEVIREFGTEEQRRTWLPRLASGTIAKMVFAVTRTDSENNTHRLSTTAKRDGEDWVLNGTKYYISGVDEAEALLVVAKTGQDALSLFIVPAKNAVGLDRMSSVDLLLPGRRLLCISTASGSARAALVGEEGAGFRQGVPQAPTGADHRCALAVGCAWPGTR